MNGKLKSFIYMIFVTLTVSAFLLGIANIVTSKMMERYVEVPAYITDVSFRHSHIRHYNVKYYYTLHYSYEGQEYEVEKVSRIAPNENLDRAWLDPVYMKNVETVSKEKHVIYGFVLLAVSAIFGFITVFITILRKKISKIKQEKQNYQNYQNDQVYNMFSRKYMNEQIRSINYGKFPIGPIISGIYAAVFAFMGTITSILGAVFTKNPSGARIQINGRLLQGQESIDAAMKWGKVLLRVGSVAFVVAFIMVVLTVVLFTRYNNQIRYQNDAI
ncbi:hypothetical protein SAMN04487770_10145 [Butyrivibrio sp. ob235]|uniref:hypothetical protein n=1 Tax=Butyrivibrio sp. ob235 TaxID=1761780 RepID=UPI0008C7F3E9|nr:hypothetical protein [Butyrivibrio sp. ob235]SEK25080.1 hypothetical protein SAMN04487770_10145 [Butyrivibrio sp. ob235]